MTPMESARKRLWNCDEEELMEVLTKLSGGPALLIDMMVTYWKPEEIERAVDGVTYEDQREPLINDLEASLCYRTGGGL